MTNVTREYSYSGDILYTSIWVKTKNPDTAVKRFLNGIEDAETRERYSKKLSERKYKSLTYGQYFGCYLGWDERYGDFTGLVIYDEENGMMNVRIGERVNRE